MESVAESVNSGLEWAYSSADSATNPLKIDLWVRALTFCCKPISVHNQYPTVTIHSTCLVID